MQTVLQYSLGNGLANNSQCSIADSESDKDQVYRVNSINWTIEHVATYTYI